MTAPIHIGQKIRQHRHLARLSQEATAEQAGISTRYLQQLEAGQNVPSVTVVFKIARALDVSYADLLNGAWLAQLAPIEAK